jgi:hypothetical protein
VRLAIAAAKRLQRANSALRYWIPDEGLPAAVARSALRHDLLLLIDSEARQLEVLDHPLGEHVARIVAHMLLEKPPQQIPLPTDRKAIAKASMSLNES